MGDVYRAWDEHLSRDVAIKSLPRVFADDTERLARLEREAKLLASLDHPKIATIHGLEESDGMRFLVLELVVGETLAARLKKKPFPLKEALEIGRQIAKGLEAAHEKGVVQRDLKPGNVILTEGNKVNILDFGLAKIQPMKSSAANGAESISESMTKPGMILGTAAFMSPEQAKGRPADIRNDIWAFGCILYQCLTGRMPFYGETVSDALAAVLKNDPDWTALPQDTPQNVRHVLRRCLEKDSALRFHDIADVRIEIGEPAAVFAEKAGPSKQISPSLALGLVVVTATDAVLVTFFLMKYLRPTPFTPLVRTVI